MFEVEVYPPLLHGRRTDDSFFRQAGDNQELAGK
jgi:hypothetical protein